MEISVNIGELEQQITNLKGLKSKWEGYDFTPPTTACGGKVALELHGVGMMYKNIYSLMLSLVDYTIRVLENTKQSYYSIDHDMAVSMESR